MAGRTTLLVAVLAAMLGSGCGGQLAAAPGAGSTTRASVSWYEGVSERGSFTARWRSDTEPIPNNEPFRLELELLDPEGRTLAGDVQVFVHAWMPAHRHGMLRRSVATRRDDGRFDVRGMLLHMGGHWKIFVDVVHDGDLEQASFDLEIE